MASKTSLILALLAFRVYAQVQKPMPVDVPYAVLVKSASITDQNSDVWSLDGGVCLNDTARKIQKDALQELQDKNADLTAQLAAKDQEKSDQTLGAPAWVGIAASIIGSVGAAVAAVVAATHK